MFVAIALAAFVAMLHPAMADDTLKVAVADVHAFENQPLAAREIFKKHGIVLAIISAHGGAGALQAVIGGSADIAIGVDTEMALRAFANGVPIRAVLPNFTGVSDLYWYVKSESSITYLAGAGDAALAYSTNGSLTHRIVTDWARELKIAGKPVATGSPSATLLDVMTGKVAVGFGRAPFGLKEVAEGKIRIIAKGADMAAPKSRTWRVSVVDAETLQKKKEVLGRFVLAWREAADALYANENARKAYAQAVNVAPDVIENALRDYFPKSALQTATVSGLDEIASDAVKQRILAALLPKERLSEFVAVPPRP